MVHKDVFRGDPLRHGVRLHGIHFVVFRLSVVPAHEKLRSGPLPVQLQPDDQPVRQHMAGGSVRPHACAEDEDGWPYMIDGKDMSDYFDNLFFAD